MKTLILLSIVFTMVFFQETYSKQGADQVCTGDVTLSSQAEVDAFNCTEITGNLTISGSDITNLDNLSSLRKVSGELRIENNPNLITLDSLFALDSIGENLPSGNPPTSEAPEALIIADNASLLHCDGLDSLHSINGGLRIEHNINLVSLNGFQNLISISWIDVSENSKLFEMFGFSSVRAIADRSNFPGRLTIRQNDNLFVLQDFPALTTVGDIRILNNNNLSNLDKFVNLTKINGYLEISGNGALSSIDGFRNLTTIAGFSRFIPSSGLIISNNASLRFITGLVSLEIVTSEFYVEVSIFNNPKLENIDGLASLTTIFGLNERKLNINNNTALENIDGLSSLIHMDAGPGPLFIKVTQNPALTSCCGLRPLLEVFDSLNVLDNLIATGNIDISGNGAGCTPYDILAGPSCIEEICGGNIELSSQAEVDAFNCTEVIGNLIISGSDITNLNSLSSLKSVSQILRIEDNINLKTLDGLSSLESVAEFYIRNNPALADVNMLSSLKTVGSLWIDSTKIVALNGFSSLIQLGGLRVMNNSSLLSISGFDSVRSGSGIGIINNAALRSINAFNNISSSSINIRMNPNLLAIDGFLSVETVQQFTVSNNESLKSIDGFGKLIRVSNPTSLSAGLTITDNASLEDFNGLSSLKSIANPFLAVVSISNNRSLKNLDGFSSLSVISGNTSTQLHIVNNEMLENIDALALVRMEPPLNINVIKNPSLTSCCGLRRTLGSLEEGMILDDLIANGDINISENGAGCTVEDILQGPRCLKEIEICDASTLSSQAEVDAFACKVVNGALVISGNDITDLSPLSILERAGTIIIRNNGQLQNVEGFTSITHIEQQLIISDNPELLTISGFNNLKSSGIIWSPSISISNNPKLTALNGFQSLQHTHSISIQDNSSLVSIHGFSSLLEVKRIEVNGNSALQTIDGFSALESISEELAIAYNTSLRSLSGFKRVTRMGGFAINNNSSLQDLDGLSSLKTLRRNNVVGTLIIYNPVVVINENSSLKNLDGLASLSTIGEGNEGASIIITNNAVLESIDGISILRVRSSDFSRVFIHVKDNPLLTRCCPLFPLLDDLGEEGISKATIMIADNGPGCTLEDILAGGMCPAAILSFDVIDIRTGDVVMPFHHDSITLDLADPNFSHLMLQANTAPQQVGSVEFILDGHIRRTENGFPYQFILPVLTPGTHTVRTEVYSKGQKQGVKGVGRTATFKVINSAIVISVDVYNLSHQPLMTLHDGDKINIKDPAFKTILFHANTVPTFVSKVEFFLNNRLVAVENGLPYELLANTSPGDYTLEAIPYIRIGGNYYAGTSLKISFKIVSEATGASGQFVMNDLSDNESLLKVGESPGVTIFPVPVDGELYIKIDDTAGKDPMITIRTIHGLTVYQESYSKSQSINTLHLPAGVYYLQVAGQGGFQKVVKFIKK